MNQGLPKVSVLIPAYNSADYIVETINSALLQTWRNIEVIVVDDGSQDDTAQRARSTHDGRVQVHERSNSGAAATRNYAFQQCTGDFIQYLDADDLLSKDKIAAQVELLRDNPGDVASCRWARFEKNPAAAQVEQQTIDTNLDSVTWLVSSWTGGGMAQTGCWLVPRSVIEKVGPWDESLIRNPNDDGEFFCRVLLASDGIQFSEQGLVYYRSGLDGSVSQIHSQQQAASLLGSYKSYRDHLLAVEDSERTRKALAANFCSFSYQMDLRFGDLAADSLAAAEALGVGLSSPTGGRGFRWLQSGLGFRNALRFRRTLSLLSKSKS